MEARKKINIYGVWLKKDEVGYVEAIAQAKDYRKKAVEMNFSQDCLKHWDEVIKILEINIENIREQVWKLEN